MNLINKTNNNSLTTIDDRLLTLMKEELNTEEQQQFVNSFKLYLKYGYDDKAFVIDFDNVWKWVGFSQKDKAKRLLINKFIEDINFIYQKEVPRTGELFVEEEKFIDNKKSKTWNKEIILLNVSTFKKFCMKASTKRAEEICDYYLKMEKIMFKYTNEKLNEIQEKYEETQNKLKNFIEYDEELFWNDNQINDFNKKNVIYIAFIGIFNNERVYKFGKSEQIYTREFKQHQKFFDIFKMRYVIECDNMNFVEKEFKKFLKSINLLKNLEIKENNLTELFTIKEKHNIEYVIENLIKLVEENPLPSLKRLTDEIEKHKITIKNLKEEVENLKKENKELKLKVKKDKKNLKFEEKKEDSNVEVQNEIIDTIETTRETIDEVTEQSNSKNKCIDCGKKIRRSSTRCLECYHKAGQFIKNRPTYEQLKEDIKELNYTGTGKKYDVSDNTIRKWVKDYEKDMTEEEKLIKLEKKKYKPTYVELMETLSKNTVKATAKIYDVNESTIRDWRKIYQKEEQEKNKNIKIKI